MCTFVLLICVCVCVCVNVENARQRKESQCLHLLEEARCNVVPDMLSIIQVGVCVCVCVWPAQGIQAHMHVMHILLVRCNHVHVLPLVWENSN